MYRYTLCFIRRGEKLLMLNRVKAPVMGLWHGVGGKIEVNETPKESIIREIYEETEIKVSDVIYKGTVSWDNSSTDGGMYVYLAELEESFLYNTPKQTNEGILDWKEISWIIDPSNRGIPQHVIRFLPLLLNSKALHNHECLFEQGTLIDYKAVPIYN